NAEDGIRDRNVTGVQTCALPIAVVSFQRVFEILDLVPYIREPEQPRRLPAGGLDVVFDHVDFAYPSAEQVSLASLEDVTVLDSRGGDEVIHDLSLTIPAGHTVALVGSSGAGKSTIASLLPRLYDVTGGSIRIGGVDVRDLSFSDLREAVGVVTQDGHVFHESIRANLALVNPDATEEQMRDAIDRAQLTSVIDALPDGLDTVVGERGYRLSGGERQRLTIARMLLAAPDIVVLDEATSALDSTNEAAIQQALAQAMSGRTALVIAHRLSTVRQADTILVVEAGRIVAAGRARRSGTAASIKCPRRYAAFERSTSARSLGRALSGSNSGYAGAFVRFVAIFPVFGATTTLTGCLCA